MKISSLYRLFASFSLMALLMTGTAFAAECPGTGAKVDNFIIFQDYSGSMAMHHAKAGKVKIVMAKNILLNMADMIPELNYNAAFATFGPYQMVMPPKKFDKASLRAAVQPLKTDYEIFDRRTPMGDDLVDLDRTVSGLSGRTAIIVITDGASNLGSDPIEQAKAVYGKYQGRVNFAIISFADEKDGKAILDRIAGMPNVVYADGVKLQDKAELQAFIEKTIAGAGQPPHAVIEGPDQVRTGQSVTFSAAKSTSAPGDTLAYAWRTSEGKTGTGETFTTTFSTSGPAEISVVAGNRANCTDTARRTIRVGAVEERIVLRGINFDFDKDTIKPEFMPVLDQGAEILKRNPNVQIVVEGYTDSIGTVMYNQSLSERRARAVENYLVRKGVSSSRITYVGHSEFFPKYDNTTAEGRYLNRRVEIKVNQ